MQESKMKKHVVIVSAIHIGFGTLELLIAIGGMLFLGKLLDFIPTDEMPDFVVSLLTYLFKVLPVILGGISSARIIGGIGLLSNKEWARITVVVVAALGCLKIPIGTLIGVYSIWVLMQDETIKMFKGELIA